MFRVIWFIPSSPPTHFHWSLGQTHIFHWQTIVDRLSLNYRSGSTYREWVVAHSADRSYDQSLGPFTLHFYLSDTIRIISISGLNLDSITHWNRSELAKNHRHYARRSAKCRSPQDRPSPWIVPHPSVKSLHYPRNIKGHTSGRWLSLLFKDLTAHRIRDLRRGQFLLLFTTTFLLSIGSKDCSADSNVGVSVNRKAG